MDLAMNPSQINTQANLLSPQSKFIYDHSD